MEIGIGLAIAVALLTNIASLLKHRGCQHAQPVHLGRPLESIRGLARSRWFMAGWGLAALAWLAHVAALSLAPISLVQTVLAGGAVTLAVLSQRLFGDRVERRQWLALFLGAAGLVLLAATLPRIHGTHSGFSLAAISSFEGGLVLLAAGIALGRRAGRLAARHGVLLAVLAGLLFALAGIAIKGLTGGAESSWPLIASLVLVTVGCGGLAQYTAVAALQSGGAIETIGLMGLVANAAQIVGGILVFGDPLSPTPLGITLQVTAFAMVCLSALLMPSSTAGPLARPRPVG
ncbi:MAG TPA: DMT family transporter [Solirubrobacterales bacterium]